MEYIIVTLFAYSMLSSTVCAGQESIVSDTSYIVTRNDTVFQVKLIQYNTGRITSDQVPIGRDASSALTELRQQGYNLSQQFATAMIIVESERSLRRTIAGYSAAINQVNGTTNYFKEVETAVGDDNLLGTYNFRVDNAEPVNASIIRNAAGLLRFRQGSTNYPLDVYSELLLRIRNYNGSDFFLVRNSAQSSQWRGGLGKYMLTKTQQR